jgi:electron transport complex protein RnfD
MRFDTASSPHTLPANRVDVVMRQVLMALIPGTAACAWFFGWGVLINIAIACVVALSCEALMLMLRHKPFKPYLFDNSALVTACLLALALPQLAPWWLTAIATAFAIIVAKHLYGGLGFNPFNPAMAGYVIVMISFPREMTQWLPPLLLQTHPDLSFIDTLQIIFTGTLPAGLNWDSVTMATPLDTTKTQLGLQLSINDIHTHKTYGALFGKFGGIGWEWINALFLAGGVWMAYKRIIDWRIPAGMLGMLALLSNSFALYDYASFPPPTFELFSGGIMLGAFFIATDPVTASTTPKGRWIYGAGIGFFVYIIRTWGGYPDGIAFAVLLMNTSAPLLDYYTMPRAYGHRWSELPGQDKKQNDE